MSEPLDIDYLKPFIESTIDASARFRRVLIVMVAASVLGFGAAWNSTSFSWLNSRIALARKAERYLMLQDMSSRLAQLEQKPNTSKKNECRNVDDKKGRAEPEFTWRAVNQILEADDEGHKTVSSIAELNDSLNKEHWKNTKEWINRRGFDQASQAQQVGQNLEEARTSNVMLVHIPFFGSVFDINDLGLLGGFTFTVILILFRFTLWREYNNLHLTFLEAKSEHLEYCYKSLAMQQVLTVPPTLSGSQPQKPGGDVVRYLYLAPLLVQGIIVGNDILTKPSGSILSANMTTLSLGFSLTFFLLMVFLIRQCRRLSISIDNEWKAWEPLAKRYSRQLVVEG